jgi:hypothetical protein
VVQVAYQPSADAQAGRVRRTLLQPAVLEVGANPAAGAIVLP